MNEEEKQEESPLGGKLNLVGFFYIPRSIANFPSSTFPIAMFSVLATLPFTSIILYRAVICITLYTVAYRLMVCSTIARYHTDFTLCQNQVGKMAISRGSNVEVC